MAFGSTVGVILEPVIGWRMLFVSVALVGACLLVFLVPYASRFPAPPSGRVRSTKEIFAGYRSLLAVGRGLRTYSYVFLNSIFHSGVYTWLGLYFARRYSLGEIGIGLALLGYGVPGFLFGPIIGRAADRYGRRWMVPTGLGIAGIAAPALILNMPVVGAALGVTALSLGYDMTQPLLAGIVTHLGGRERGGQAMGLNVFALFTGFGVGSLLFGEALRFGFGVALGIFGGFQLVAALTAIPFFRFESVKETAPVPVR
jgi:predicted MFS family arabinose efflux permease